MAASDRTQVLERYQAGETANALADAFDVNRATIFAVLRRAGIKSRYRILTDRDVLAATAMYEAGKSLASIARRFDVADRTVLHAFRRAGVPTRACGTNQWSGPAALSPAIVSSVGGSVASTRRIASGSRLVSDRKAL